MASRIETVPGEDLQARYEAFHASQQKEH